MKLHWLYSLRPHWLNPLKYKGWWSFLKGVVFRTQRMRVLAMRSRQLGRKCPDKAKQSKPAPPACIKAGGPRSAVIQPYPLESRATVYSSLGWPLWACAGTVGGGGLLYCEPQSPVPSSLSACMPARLMHRDSSPGDYRASLCSRRTWLARRLRSARPWMGSMRRPDTLWCPRWVCTPPAPPSHTASAAAGQRESC